MKKLVFLFFILFSLSFYTKAGKSVTFIVNVTPDALEGGKNNQLLNFTINVIGTANITEVNIILPPGFSFTGNLGSSSCKYDASRSSTTNVIWTNGLTGCIDNSTLQYFWIYVNTPSSSEKFNFTVWCNGTDSQPSSTNITISLYDITAPQYSQNITTFPPSPTNYSPGKTYWFNISWTDNVAVDKVLLEQNFTTLSPSLENISLDKEGSTYYFKIVDLPAGLYLFKWYANDTNNTFNSTPSFIYNITKANNFITIWFNQTKNSNFTTINGSLLNITGEISCNQTNCNLSIIRNSASIILPPQKSPSSVIDGPLYSTALFNYTITTAGNQNYTSNSSTFFVMVVPNYTISYSVPTSYSSTSSSFSINFSSSPGIDNLFLELNGVRYVMTNSSLTTYSYSSTLPAGSYFWQILGNYSNHIFNLTALNSFTIQKASPSVSLTAYPGWIVYEGNQTRVSCSSPYVSVSLYRNNTAVQNPDSQTLPVGDYLYICNSTETQNYSAQSVSNILSVIETPTYVVDLAFTQVENLIFITQNSSNFTIIKVKNTGNLTQTIYFLVENINSSWYSTNSTNATLMPNKEAAFLVNFFVGEIEPKDYNGIFKANSTYKTINSSFILRVLPSENFKININYSLAQYEQNYTSLLREIEKKKNEGYNTSLAEQKLSQLKSLLEQAKNYLDNNDYLSVYNLFGDIKLLIGETKIEIDAATRRGKIPTQFPSWIIYIAMIIVVVFVSGFLAYLFWPTEKVEVQQQPEAKEQKESLLEKIKKLLKLKK
jgi:hypothetical protein